MLVMVSAGL